jgi:hypothetical protein
MSLQIRLSDFITSVGTDYKQFRTWITGSAAGDLTGLTTTAKTSLLAAVNEVNAKVPPAPPASTELVAGVIQIATQAETDAGLVDTDAVTPLKFQTRMAAFAQPLNANLTAIAALAGQTAYGRAFLTLVNQAGLVGLLPISADAVVGVSRNATQAETNTGTLDTAAVTPLKLQTRLVAYAQPLAANLTTLAGVASGVMGRTLLGAADANAAKTSLGLAAVATSGSASDITTGTLPSSVLPPLAINETFTAATQAAMLALTAQRGDVAIRSDLGGKFYILTTDSPTTLADWKPLVASSDVLSVAGRTGAVVLTSTDVGLANVNNTSDVNKPVSTAQAAADALNLKIASNLADLNNATTARANLSVYSQAELGNPETDLVALYATAKT